MKLGNNIQNIYKKYLNCINNLNKILSTKKRTNETEHTKKIIKLRSKIRNIVENIDNNTSSFFLVKSV